MKEIIVALVFAVIFCFIVLITNAEFGNPFKLSKKSIRTLAILALIVGAGIYYVAINFNSGCNPAGCYIHWGNPLTN